MQQQRTSTPVKPPWNVQSTRMLAGNKKMCSVNFCMDWNVLSLT